MIELKTLLQSYGPLNTLPLIFTPLTMHTKQRIQESSRHKARSQLTAPGSPKPSESRKTL